MTYYCGFNFERNLDILQKSFKTFNKRERKEKGARKRTFKISHFKVTGKAKTFFLQNNLLISKNGTQRIQ